MPFTPVLRRPVESGHAASAFWRARQRTATVINCKPGEPIIAAKNLWKVFGPTPEKAVQVLSSGAMSKDEARDKIGAVVGVGGVDFEIQRGEFFCIMGLSGSGKSTLLRHLNRLIEPTAGSITIDGCNIGRLNDLDLRQLRAEKVSMVFQGNALFPHWTVLENVAFGLAVLGVPKAARRKKAMETLELVQLAGWSNYYPNALSGGMRQRVGLARAVATDAEVLLMDEPFGALDPLIRRQLQDEFLDLTRRLGKTTVFITHDLDEAIRLGDRIAIMKEGRFVQMGGTEEIVTKPADSYVASFVRGISRLKLVRAGTVMQPIEAYKSNNPTTNLSKCRTVETTADLERLIELKADQLDPVVVLDGMKRAVGVVTVVDLLNGIRGSIETSAEKLSNHQLSLVGALDA